MSQPIQTTRCTGECCKEFVVNRHSYRSLLNLAIQEAADAPDGVIPQSVRVAAMVRPVVGESALQARQGKWVTEAQRRFTCVHLLPSGDCGNYDERPDLCRDYPYGNPCEHGSACTWTDAPLVTIKEKLAGAAEAMERLR